MLTRSVLIRHLGAILLANALLASSLIAPARAQVGPQEAAEFIQRAGGELAATIGGAGSVEEKRRRITPFMAEVVDVEGVARFVLGRFWRLATPEQQRTYVGLFNQVLANSIAGRLGEYRGADAVKVTVGRPDPRPEGVLVPTTILRPNNQPVNVTWLVTEAGGKPKVADVIAEGMSLRLAQRSDYSAYIQRNNNDVGALIRALEAQVSQGAGLR